MLIDATNITRADYGPGDGPIWLDNVRCNPLRDMSLLECPHRPTPVNSCNHTRDAGVQCRDDQGEVKTISATIINPVHTLMITWSLGNSTRAGAPIMFKIECFSEKHRIAITVSNQTSTTNLEGLLPSTSYACCVSAVYKLYTARRICTEVETTSTTVTITDSEETTGAATIDSEEIASNSTNVVGGVLGFIIAVLLILLALSGILLSCQVRSQWKQRLNRIRARYVLDYADRVCNLWMIRVSDYK